MRIQDGELAGNQQNVSKFVFGDYCSFVTYLIDNLGLVQYSQLLVNVLGYGLIYKYAFQVKF